MSPSRLPAILLAVAVTACGEPVVPELPVAPPRVERMAPAAGSVGIARAAIVTVTFSEPVRPATVHEGTVRLYTASTLVRADVRLIDDGRTAQLIPRDLLDLDTEYTAVVAGTVETADGRAVVGRSWKFMTKRTRGG